MTQVCAVLAVLEPLYVLHLAYIPQSTGLMLASINMVLHQTVVLAFLIALPVAGMGLAVYIVHTSSSPQSPVHSVTSALLEFWIQLDTR